MHTPINHVQIISQESARFSAAVPADLDRRVPSCPDWDARALVMHLGDVQRFWAVVVGAGGAAPTETELPDPPADRDGMIAWFTEGTALLVTAIEAVDPAAPAWTWWGEPATAGAIARHQVQEAAVHRVDAEQSAGAVTPLDPAVADDGVAEFLEVMLGERAAGLSPVRLQATDTGSSWQVGSGPSVATLSAGASDLVMLLYRRISVDAATVDGDRSAVEALIAATAAD